MWVRERGGATVWEQERGAGAVVEAWLGHCGDVGAMRDAGLGHSAYGGYMVVPRWNRKGNGKGVHNPHDFY